MRFSKEILNTGKSDSMYFAVLFNSLVMEFFQPMLTKTTIYKGFIIGDSLLNFLNLCIKCCKKARK